MAIMTVLFQQRALEQVQERLRHTAHHQLKEDIEATKQQCVELEEEVRLAKVTDGYGTDMIRPS